MGIMHYCFKRDFDKTKTAEERVRVFQKYGWDEERLRKEVEEKRRSITPGGIHRCELDPRLLECLLGIGDQIALAKTSDGRDFQVITGDPNIIDPHISLALTILKEIREEKQKDPIKRFDELISDYGTLEYVERFRHGLV